MSSTTGSPSSRRTGRPAPALRPALIVGTVAAATFFLALDDGSYSLASRTSLAIAAWWIAAIGWASGGWPTVRPPNALLALVGLLAVFASWTALSMAWAADVAAAYDEVVRVLLYLGVVLLIATIAERGEIGLWADGLTIGIVAVATLALASRLFPDVVDVDSRYRFLSATVARLSYPIGYWNGLAILVALSIPLLLRVAVTARRSPVRAAAVASFVPVTSVIYLTSSRGGALVSLVGALSFFALAPRRWPVAASLLVGAAGAIAAVVILQRFPELVNDPLSEAAAGQGSRAAVLLIVSAVLTASVLLVASRAVARIERRVSQRLLVGAVVAVTTALVVAANPIERLEEFTELPQVTATDRGYVTEHLLSASGNGRWQYWEVAVGQFREAPLRGAGAGSFHEAWEQKRPISSYVLDAHSLYVEALGELGVVGLGMIAGLVILAGAVIVQTSRRAQESQRPTIASLSAVVLGFGVALGVDWMWELTAVAVVGVAVLTLLACLSPNGGRSWSVPIRWRLAAVAAAVMAIAVAVIPLLASTRLEASQAAVRRGATDEALSEARAARDLQPWAAAPYLQLALIEEQSGRLRAARAWLSEAQERDPRNAALWLIAARLHTKSGLLQAARSDLARARRLNPFLRLPS